MAQEFLMGNEAIAKGAIAAGLNLVAGYPGTPSTEVLETVAKFRDDDVYVEWSVNEKAAMEVAAGAAYCGANVMVTMKQVGLNVASDPLMSLEYVGIKGAMVVMVADDPGPISSQTEQDTRTFAMFSKIPCFDPSSPQEAYDMIIEAFAFSRKHKTPVFFRPTTRICHAYSSVKIADEIFVNKPEGFIKDSKRWVIFPKLSNRNHALIEERNRKISDEFSSYERNKIIDGDLKLGIATHGISYANTVETLKSLKNKPSVLKISTPFPFPEKLAYEFLKDKKEVLCIEELDPVIERALISVCGKYGLKTVIRGKMTDDVKLSGENLRDDVKHQIYAFLGLKENKSSKADNVPELPVRPPVLCAGCPHRASFYAVKKAMKGQKTLFAGDIGCYTLGNAMPLDMCDTCLCMGAGVNIAQGVGRIEPNTKCFAFVGDSTFFASAITGAVNAVYNGADMTLVILDNSTTAMTGHQPHPGTGKTMMGEITAKVDIKKVLEGIGISDIAVIDPLKLDDAVETVKEMASRKGVKAIIFSSPCAMIFRPQNVCKVDTDKCVDCRMCVKEIGCPGIVIKDGRVVIDSSLCNGCGLCSQICPADAIGSEVITR